MSPLRTHICIMLALATAVAMAYWQVVSHEFIELDDLTYIVQNPPVAKGLTLDGIRWAFTTSHAGNWHPLTWLSHMLDVTLFGLNPGGHHLMNVALHLANTLLLFHLLTTCTQATWRSAMVAALFALHPLHVESVAWAAERKDVLSTLFFLLTLLGYQSYVRRPTAWTYLRTLTLFIAGLLAKSMLVSLPLVLLLWDLWPLGRIQTSAQHTAGNATAYWRLLREKLPFFAVTLLFCGITFYSQSAGNAVSVDAALSLGVRLQNALIAYGAYLRDMLWPIGLAPFYPLTVPIPTLPVILATIPIILISLMVVRYWRSSAYLLTGWLWYIITLVPVIGLVQVGLQSRADRYTYIPLIGVFIAIVWGGSDLARRWRLPRYLIAGISSGVLLALAILCQLQVARWENSITLFSHTSSVTTRNYLADMILGNAYFSQRNFPAAIGHYQRALLSGANGAVIHMLETKLATCFGVLGRFDEALYHYKLAAQAAPTQPATYYLMGQLQETRGDTNAAIASFRRSLDLDPNQLDANLAIAPLLQRQGDERSALAAYEVVLRHQPENADALYVLGMAKARQGETSVAIDFLTRALRQRPTFIDAQRSLETLRRLMPR